MITRSMVRLVPQSYDTETVIPRAEVPAGVLAVGVADGDGVSVTLPSNAAMNAGAVRFRVSPLVLIDIVLWRSLDFICKSLGQLARGSSRSEWKPTGILRLGHHVEHLAGTGE
ncbi:MAG: hypothetical protein CK552_02770 [Actinobacteria bacterium]|nr:MAG: hypothetical protein CK552_02770 [Actinomycetota bacterium]